MRDKQLVDFTSLLIWMAIVVIRRNFGGPAHFPSELFIEDFILLLMVAVVLLPARFGPLVSSLVSCSICILIALMALSPSSHKIPLSKTVIYAVFFALFGTYGAVRALIETSRLWQNRRKGIPPEV